MHGILHAYCTILIPISWSKFSPFKFLSFCDAYKRATPPPGTIPSSEAALVAHNASSILSFNSATSTSDAPPTLITATPPVSLPYLSYNFSLSYSDVVISIAEVIYWTLSSISAFSPDPPMIIVSSLEIIIFSADPNTSNSDSSKVNPTSSLINWAPVAIAISYIVFLLLSPNPGDFTAHT